MKALEVKVAKVLYSNAYDNLAELKGSVKQVAWASDIRDAKIAEVFINDACIKHPFLAKVLVNVLKRQDSARFWIDNRDHDCRSIAMELKAEVLAEKTALESELGNIDEYNKNYAETEMRRLFGIKNQYYAKSETFDIKSDNLEEKRLIDHIWLAAKELLDDYKKVYPNVDFEVAKENTEVTAEEVIAEITTADAVDASVAAMEEVNKANANTENAVENVEEVKKFEVGKVYVNSTVFKIKVLKRTKATITYTDNNGVIQKRARIYVRNNIERVSASGLLDTIALPYAANDIENEEPEKTESQIIIEESENKIHTLKDYAANYKRDMEYYSEQIIQYYGYIAKYENFIWEAYLKVEDAEKEAVAIEAAIANQHLIDVTDEIVTAAGIDASVAAMEEINAANNFSVELLMAAITKAEKAVELIPVTFNLQAFNNTADDSNNTADDSEIDNQASALRKKILKLENQIAELENQKYHLEGELANLYDAVVDDCNELLQSKGVIEKIEHITEEEFNSFTLHFPDRGGFSIHYADDWKDNLFWEVGDSTIDLIYCSKFNLPKALMAYSTATQFKAVIRELVKAIKRGEEEFTFPADIPPAYEDIPFDEDDCFIDELDEEEIAANLWF